MAARKTVNVDIKTVCGLVDQNGWSNATFAKKVGKHSRWLSEIARGRNLPSPEEAARMCALLGAAPEDLLPAAGETEAETAKRQADIALVRSLLDAEYAEKERPADGGTPNKDALLRFIQTTDDRVELLAAMEEISKRLRELG